MITLRRFWRRILILLGIKRITPRWGERPGAHNLTPVGFRDTGGGGWYRPTFRPQDPSADPQEPGGGESSSAGSDHGWSNCTLTSGAMALDYHTAGALEKWGGHLRHKQGDLSGGTDLYDLRDAWAAYGETLTIRSGAGWDAMKEDSLDGHFIVLQGEGNVPGAETYSGGHAIAVSPERNGDGNWLIGDPLASGWQWATGSSIRDWAERWNSGISYAISKARKPETQEPEPEPEPEPECPPEEMHSDDWIVDMLVGAHGDGYAKAYDEVLVSWLHIPVRFNWDVAKWDEAGWSSQPIPTSWLANDPLWDSAIWSGSVWVEEYNAAID